MKFTDTQYTLQISGLNLHHILTYFEQKSFQVTNIKRIEQKTLICTLNKRDYKEFKKEPLASAYKIKILERKGVENLAYKAFSNIGLIIGFIACLVCSYFATDKIYEVHYNTNDHVCTNNEDCIFSEKNFTALKDFLYNYNIYDSVPINNLPLSSEIEKALMKNFKQVSGASITRKGVHLYVNIIEGKLKESKQELNLTAEHTGYLVSLDVTEGKQAVDLGQIVLQGQTLVEAVDGRNVVATATIRTFYHETMIYNENQIKYVRTGEKIINNSISLFGLSFNSSNNKYFDLYESETKYKYPFINSLLPIKLEQTIMYELEKQETLVSFETAQVSLKEDLKNQLLETIPNDAEIKNTTYTTFQEGSRTRLDCYIEAYITQTKKG